MKRADFEKFDVVYKYRSCEFETSWRILENQEIYFASPSTFNDPFDCNFSVRYELLSDADLYSAMRELVVASNQSAGSHLIDGLTKRAVEAVRNPERMELATRMWIDNHLKYIGIFCASVERDNILLWSHYAYNHTGYAIGFSREGLYKLWDESDGIVLGGPIYDSDCPVFTPQDIEPANREDTWIRMVNTKSIIWEYEKELRMIIKAGDNRARKFDDEIIKEVVLGCRMEAKHKERLLKTVAELYPEAAIYQSFISRDSFSLKMQRIN